MSRRIENAPWPRQTQPAVSHQRSPKRRKVDIDTSLPASSSLSARQALESEVGKCCVVDLAHLRFNLVLPQRQQRLNAISFPEMTSSLVFRQRTPSLLNPNLSPSFVRLICRSFFCRAWLTYRIGNSQLPSYAQTNKVNIYLFHGDSNEQILEIPNVDNSKYQAGVITLPANDSWWGENGPDFSGTNTSYGFYFGITPNTTTFDASAHTQTHFTAVRESPFTIFLISSVLM